MIQSTNLLPRRRGFAASGILWVLAAVVSGAAGFLSMGEAPAPTTREFTVRARTYAYDPPVIRVNRGDTVRLRFVSEDVVHGFFLEGHGFDATIVPLRNTVELRRTDRPDVREEVEVLEFVADRAGKFRYRCSSTCGFLHPFMVGEFIVGPNRLLGAGVGSVVGLLLGGLALGSLRRRMK